MKYFFQEYGIIIVTMLVLLALIAMAAIISSDDYTGRIPQYLNDFMNKGNFANMAGGSGE